MTQRVILEMKRSNLHNVGVQLIVLLIGQCMKGSSQENKLRFGYGSNDYLVVTDSGSSKVERILHHQN